MPTKFFDDPELQKEYEQRVEMYVSTFKSMFKNYIPEFHDSIVEELVRTEISIRRWERLIYHDQESKGIISLLENDRKHYNNLLDKMMVFLKSMEMRKTEDTRSIVDKMNKTNEKFLKIVQLFDEALSKMKKKDREAFMEKLNEILDTE